MNEDWSHVILLDLAEAVFYCSNHPRAKMPAKELLENKYMNGAIRVRSRTVRTGQCTICVFTVHPQCAEGRYHREP